VISDARSERYPCLMSAASVGGVEIRNRVAQMPMGTGMMRDGRVTDGDVAFMEERARGGVGLIITGAGPVHETSIVAGRILTEAWDEAGLEGLRRRVEAVHAHGTKIFGQILHLGRESSGDTMAGGATEYVPLAPSAIASPRDPSPPHEMTGAEVRWMVSAYGRAAANFRQAGYDGIEIQACHGYLAAQFLTRSSNRRTDAYRGDTLEGRVRFLVEVIEEVRSRCGAGFPVGVRVSGEDLAPGGLAIDDTLEIVDALQDAAPVDYISVTTGVRGAYVKDTTFAEGFARGFAAAIKDRVDVPVIVAGRVRTPAVAEAVLASGEADLIGLGRALLADPEWALKVREGRDAEIRPCIGCVQDCRRAIGLIGCTIHARTGREHEWGPERRATRTARVLVAGGGPAGLETARLAAAAGYDVTLLERDDRLGGQLCVAAAAPTREELLDFVSYCQRELGRLGVDVCLGAEATKEAVLEREPDLFVCATGASPAPAELAIVGDARVVNVWELLGGSVSDLGERAVVIDDGSGFWHGVGAAEWLAERGVAVELVTRARGVALTIPHESAGSTLRRLRLNGVRFHTLVTAARIDGHRVQLADAITGEPCDELEADLIVVRTPLRADAHLAFELDGQIGAIAVIGDCAAPRRLTHAVLDANRAIRRFAGGELSSAAMVVV
jgi:2,4-dienoyl-CoA reductase-like NADH-dependent reductase (Old Yellow Enzyme family)